jgi:hypothetical protein
MDNEDVGQPDETLTPVEQDAITFYGHPIVAARLSDGRIAVFLLWMYQVWTFDL